MFMQNKEVNGHQLDGNFSTRKGNESNYRSVGNAPQETNEQGSPLYGPNFQSKLKEKQRSMETEVGMLNEPEVIQAVRHAEGIYAQELQKLGYSPLTINSYSSAIDRFVQFLEIGQVVPDYNNKPDNTNRIS
jgi:hypothetical protein